MLVYQKSLLLVIVPFIAQLLFMSALFFALKDGEAMIDEELQRTQVAHATRMLLARAYRDFSKNCETIVGDNSASVSPKRDEVKDLLKEVRIILGRENDREMQSLDREWTRTEAFVRGVAEFLSRENLNKEEKRGLFCLAELRLDALSKACHSVNDAMEKRVSKHHGLTVKHRFDKVILPAISLSVLVALALAAFLNADLGRSIRRLCDNCRRIGDGEELPPPMTGKDELAELDRALHKTASALRGSLAREQAVLDNATNAILRVDTNYQIVSSNPAWEKQFGTIAARFNHNLLALIDKDKVDVFRQALDSIPLKDSQSMTLEMPLVDSQDRKADLLWSLSWDNKRNLYYCVAHDITEQKEVEARRQEFVAMLTHDLRSPLTSVGVAIELCLSSEKSLEPPMADSLKNEKESVRNVVTKINSLLDLERLESGHIDLDCVEIDVNFLFDELIQKMQRSKREVEKSVLTRRSIKADPDRIWEVLSSIMGNAIAHSPPDKRIVLSARDEGDWVEIAVKDEGSGIPEERLIEIFDRYKTLSQTEQSDAKSGFGLLLAKAIIDAHGGEIGIESSSKTGTRVWFKLEQWKPPAEVNG